MKKLTKDEIKSKLKKLDKGFCLTDDWPWKPYKDYTISAIIEHNPQYVLWAIRKGMNLDKEAEEFLTYVLESKYYGSTT